MICIWAIHPLELEGLMQADDKDVIMVRMSTEPSKEGVVRLRMVEGQLRIYPGRKWDGEEGEGVGDCQMSKLMLRSRMME